MSYRRWYLELVLVIRSLRTKDRKGSGWDKQLSISWFPFCALCWRVQRINKEMP